MIRLELIDSPLALTVFWEENIFVPGNAIEFCIAPKELRLPLPDELHEKVYTQIAAAVVESTLLRKGLRSVLDTGQAVTLPRSTGSLGRLTIMRDTCPERIKVRIVVRSPFLQRTVAVPVPDLMQALSLPNDNAN